MEYTKYAAVGHFKCHRTLDGKKYPVVIVGRKEYMLDVQEMTVWSSLAWRILSRSQIAEAYLKLTRGLSFTSRRTLDDCIDRLVSRGLVAEGRGSSEYEALYDLLSCLYIAPVSANPFLRIGAFLKLWIWDGMPFSKAIHLFSRPKCSAEERQIVRLANQALLSSRSSLSGAEYEKDPCMAHTTAAEVAAVVAALPAVPGRSHRFCVLRRSDVSDPQRIALAFLRRSLRRALCNARERTLLRGGRHLSFGFQHSVSTAAQGRAAKSRRRTARLLHRKEQAAVCGASLSDLFAAFRNSK